MVQKKKIKTPLLFTVFFVLAIFTPPMTLSAAPAVKCPCFTAGEIERAIAKAGPDAAFECSHYIGQHLLYHVDGLAGVEINAAEIRIGSSIGYVAYSMFGSVPYRNTAAYPACGTMDALWNSSQRVNIEPLDPPEGEVLSPEHQACIDTIMQVCESHAVTIDTSWCDLMMDPWYYTQFPPPSYFENQGIDPNTRFHTECQ